MTENDRSLAPNAPQLGTCNTNHRICGEVHPRNSSTCRQWKPLESGAPLPPPNAPPNYGKMLVDEWGILPELSSQHGRKIWEKTVKLYEEVLKLRALPPPQARTPRMDERVEGWLRDYSMFRPDKWDEIKAYLLEFENLGAESAPQEAGAREIDMQIVAEILRDPYLFEGNHINRAAERIVAALAVKKDSKK